MRGSSSRRGEGLLSALLLGSLLAPTANALDTYHYDRRKAAVAANQKREDIPELAKDATLDYWNGLIPLEIANNCDDKIWPAILTQNGDNIGTGGFELESGKTKLVWVGKNWEGRIWGRTNCTANGDSVSCKTGDCGGQMHCMLSGIGPATLTEITLIGGAHQNQSFYDISLVDGYNLPMAVNHIPHENTTKFIPPNLTNPACIATAGWIWDPTPVSTIYSSPEFPIPWEIRVTNKNVRRWCPWDLLAFPPNKPGDGVFPYPDDDIPREDFSPCHSRCAVTNAPEDCCTGKYHDPNKCKPSHYSRAAKAMCPDAYSYAYDDKLSTFTVPTGGGFEVVFCPKGRSTNILATLAPPLLELTATGSLGEYSMALVRNATYIRRQVEDAAGNRALVGPAWLAICVALASFLLLV